MISPDVENIEAVRAKVVSLIIECPTADNHNDCPLHAQRQRSFSDKFEWLKALPEADLQNIYLTHCECMKSKMYRA